MAPCALALVLALQSHTEFTFVRHGETIANATGRYNERTLNSLSDKGNQEVRSLTSELLRMPQFDKILVSPAPRVLATIAPYLRETHQRATIWPLLYECCTGRRPKNAHATKYSWGGRIKIPLEFAGLFVVQPGHDRYPVAPKYDQGLAQVDAAVTEFRSFSRGRLLLVGHSGQGGHFIHALTGKWMKLDNARLEQVSG